MIGDLLWNIKGNCYFFAKPSDDAFPETLQITRDQRARIREDIQAYSSDSVCDRWETLSVVTTVVHVFVTHGAFEEVRSTIKRVRCSS